MHQEKPLDNIFVSAVKSQIDIEFKLDKSSFSINSLLKTPKLKRLTTTTTTKSQKTPVPSLYAKG